MNTTIIDHFSLHGCFVVEDKVTKGEFYTYHNPLFGYDSKKICLDNTGAEYDSQ